MLHSAILHRYRKNDMNDILISKTMTDISQIGKPGGIWCFHEDSVACAPMKQQDNELSSKGAQLYRYEDTGLQPPLYLCHSSPVPGRSQTAIKIPKDREQKQQQL